MPRCKMVIMEDLKKLLLYQKLNLGFQCQFCNRKFYNTVDQLEHSRKCQQDLTCTTCGKTFGHAKILQLHMQFHNINSSLVSQSLEKRTVEKAETTDSKNMLLDKGLNGGESKQEETKASSLIGFKSLDDPSIINTTNHEGSANSRTSASNSFRTFETFVPWKTSSQRRRVNPKPAKKKVGLTKIKMEDCLRCDACSCIYIDEKDYYKHMRNFHHKDVTKNPAKQQRSKRKCQSCCKQCRGSHCSPVKKPRATQHASNLIFRFDMKNNIKNRWTEMVSQQLKDNSKLDSNELEPIDIKQEPSTNISIKEEPEPDISYLLSQVEVKIKTEPITDF